MNEGTDHAEYELSRPSEPSLSGEGSFSIPIKAIKIFSQALVLIIAGAVGGGGTTLAIRGANPFVYNSYTKAAADRMDKYAADQRSLIWKEVNRHMSINKEKAHEWEMRFDMLDHEVLGSASTGEECLRRVDRLDVRFNTLEGRLWQNNRSQAGGIKGLVWLPTQ